MSTPCASAPLKTGMRLFCDEPGCGTNYSAGTNGSRFSDSCKHLFTHWLMKHTRAGSLVEASFCDDGDARFAPSVAQSGLSYHWIRKHSPELAARERIHQKRHGKTARERARPVSFFTCDDCGLQRKEMDACQSPSLLPQPQSPQGRTEHRVVLLRRLRLLNKHPEEPGTSHAEPPMESLAILQRPADGRDLLRRMWAYILDEAARGRAYSNSQRSSAKFGQTDRSNRPATQVDATNAATRGATRRIFGFMLFAGTCRALKRCSSATSAPLHIPDI